MRHHGKDVAEHTLPAYERLLEWLIERACPLWSTYGVDREHGGFYERLNGTEGLLDPRRARVQPRQVCAFAISAALGWRGDAAKLATHGLLYFVTHYRRPDGLFRTLVAPDGRCLDERALLYDQAFALLGLAEAQRVLGPRPEFVDVARLLRAAIDRHLKRAGPGFDSGERANQPRSANAHMHLFEAAQVWTRISDDAEWHALANEIACLALSRFIDNSTGAIRENFTPAWLPLPGVPGQIIEPGHQFEWAWLLLRWGGTGHAGTRDVALRLIEIGERYGVRDDVVINTLLDDFSIHDASARLWPQTERLKAAVLAASLTGEPRYWTMAMAAATTLFRYFDTPVTGSWYDRLLPDGRLVEEPAPASSFYHIATAIAELSAVRDTACGRKSPAQSSSVSERGVG